mgnify:CR=1 FL=1
MLFRSGLYGSIDDAGTRRVWELPLKGKPRPVTGAGDVTGLALSRGRNPVLVGLRESTVIGFTGVGRVLLSFREIGTIAILDPDREEIVWATRGPWLRQHDPDLLASGNILLFDNQGYVGPGGITRVIEFDPASQQIVWQYAGTPEHPFESEVRSSQARLANGNTLITESDGGRLFEVAANGDIVWNWVNPVRGQRKGDSREVIPIVSWAERIDPGFLDRLAVASLQP